ncbi:hypothetical protein BBJ28_00018472 [Nothophytophthora sp. Chile5]|nr:hypothetical protein BBJ28_00018472 [Nothophytophthora sp. Chile5]
MAKAIIGHQLFRDGLFLSLSASIAAGGFGSVYRGQWFGTEVVVKEIIVHGDLKGNNILIGKDGVAKLTDFGLSFFRKNADSEAEQGALGAYRWKSPECLDGGVATFASDIFSFGMCIIEAVSGALPWGNDLLDIAVKYYVTKGELPNRPTVFEDEEWDLVQQMCCSDPQQRLNIVSVVVRLTAIVECRDANRHRLLQTAYKSDMLVDRENERMGAHTGGLNTLLQLVQSGVASRQNAARYAMQTFSTLTQGNVLAEQEVLQVVKLFHSDDTKQDWAAIALGYVNCPYEWKDRGTFPALVDLMMYGDDQPKNEAQTVLYARGHDRDDRMKIPRDPIDILTAFVRVGTAKEKLESARVLHRLAGDNDATRIAIVQKGGVDSLIALVRDGTDSHKVMAAEALGRLAAGNDATRTAIAHGRGIAPLIALVRDGAKSQKNKAAEALGLLAGGNNAT